jgi:hypothetical protein
MRTGWSDMSVLAGIGVFVVAGLIVGVIRYFVQEIVNKFKR